MRIALVNPPVPAGRFTNRDLMGGMGIDDGFGVGLGPRFVALLKNEGTRLPLISLAFAAALLRDHDVTVLDQSRLDPNDPAALAALVAAKPDWVIAASSFAFLGAEPHTPIDQALWATLKDLGCLGAAEAGKIDRKGRKGREGLRKAETPSAQSSTHAVAGSAH